MCFYFVYGTFATVKGKEKTEKQMRKICSTGVTVSLVFSDSSEPALYLLKLKRWPKYHISCYSRHNLAKAYKFWESARALKTNNAAGH